MGWKEKVYIATEPLGFQDVISVLPTNEYISVMWTSIVNQLDADAIFSHQS